MQISLVLYGANFAYSTLHSASCALSRLIEKVYRYIMHTVYTVQVVNCSLSSIFCTFLMLDSNLSNPMNSVFTFFRQGPFSYFILFLIMKKDLSFSYHQSRNYDTILINTHPISFSTNPVFTLYTHPVL